MRVLSIDGGGIRGLIPALVLTEIETRSEKRIFELFDLIAGTSTGGILACALCAPDPLPAEQLVSLYRDEGPKIFDRDVFQRIRSGEGLLDERYDADALERALDRFLSDKRLAEAKPDLLVPAYNMTEPGPNFFKTRKARENPETDDFPLSVVARATSAAPTYFEPLEVNDSALVDGGVFAVNPAMSAFAEVMRFQPTAEVLLVSLGTGQRTRQRTFDQVKDWGLIEWAKPILDVVFDGMSDVVDYQLEHALEDGRYWRLQTELDLASDDLDDASELNLELLGRHAEVLIETRSEDLDEIIAALTS
ncbi:MAG TPA: CBASS cGAMP-activated phospholipase [Thermoleophilaceae bacterium]|nr:CBASS cGAMP-activated phospholipase [Thermoleophilaceae bacterium]